MVIPSASSMCLGRSTAPPKAPILPPSITLILANFDGGFGCSMRSALGMWVEDGVLTRLGAVKSMGGNECVGG